MVQYTGPGTQDPAAGESSIVEAFAICETTTENVGLTALLFHETPAFPLLSRTALIQALPRPTPYSSYRVARRIVPAATAAARGNRGGSWFTKAKCVLLSTVARHATERPLRSWHIRRGEAPKGHDRTIMRSFVDVHHMSLLR